MATMTKNRRKQEFGDFQTPPDLAHDVCSLLAGLGIAPASILEPTCGIGNFIAAAAQKFPTVCKAVGIEINSRHVDAALRSLMEWDDSREIEIRHADFFHTDWDNLLTSLPDPLLVIGNPPWVTNSALGSLGSSNLPEKTNYRNNKGIDAITGKSNFDISEWMIARSLEWASRRRATVAMLCKTVVARNVLRQMWKRGDMTAQADIYNIDARSHFGAAVDACLLVVSTSEAKHPARCRIHPTLAEHPVESVIGYENGRLLANIDAYNSWKRLEGDGSYRWRSGVKHDCAKVMELREFNGKYQNGLGETVNIESDYIYPMFKSSDVANPSEPPRPSRYVIVPQRFVGEDTASIESRAPRTWDYLSNHSELFERRASSVYRNRPKFSIFGVGDYSFATWKVAVSGFYKKLGFRVLGPSYGKPAMLDDTCYFIPCQTQEEAACIAEMLNSKIAEEFFSAFVFWDAKRPITIEILQRLDLSLLAHEVGMQASLSAYRPSISSQLRLV